MYDLEGSDTDREWVEVLNIDTLNIDISTFKLFENDTNHKLSIVQGSETLAPGGYAIIADDATTFLQDYPTYTGTLFDSSFSLSNSGETLSLKNGDTVINEVTYALSTGASGDGNSLQLIDGTWQATVPTPGAENILAPPPEEAEIEAPAIAYMVISEIQVAGVDVGDEFVELYNPTDSDIDISEWSIQYVSGSADTVSTSTVSKKNLTSDNEVPAKRFFLIARGTNTDSEDGYVGNTEPDMTHRTFSLSGAAAGAKLFLVSNQEKIESVNDSDIVDWVDYAVNVPEKNKSLERKAWQDGFCVSPSGAGGFLGNGCDTDNVSADFEIRELPRPQNIQNLLEPRSAPNAPLAEDESLGIATYDPDTLEVVFAWQSVEDVEGETENIFYEIQEYASPGTVIFNASGTTEFRKRVDEVGREYTFSLQAIDRDGLGSSTTTITIAVPRILDNFYFYKDSRASATDYLIDMRYDEYPFVPDIYKDAANDTWKTLVFYLNSDAAKESFLYNTSAWEPTDRVNTLAIAFKQCSGGNIAKRRSLILPDTSDRCGVGGGLTNSAFLWSELEDNRIVVKLASSTSDVVFTPDDYFTVAFYSFYQSGGGNQTLKLVAIDKTKNHFQVIPPLNQPPTAPEDLEFDSYTISSPTSTVSLTWDASTDPDSPDNTIFYEWSVDETLWKTLVLTGASSTKRSGVIPLGLGSSYVVSLRAVDDFGSVSDSVTTTVDLPAQVVDTTPDSSNPYFAVDEAKLEGGTLKIKWRLISNPAPNAAFGIIPFSSGAGAPASLSGFRALHKEYTGNSYYSLTTASDSGQCNAQITPIGEYEFGWQYETHFSSLGGVPVSDLVGEEIEFGIYVASPCNVGDSVSSPLFVGLPVTVTE